MTRELLLYKDGWRNGGTLFDFLDESDVDRRCVLA